MGTVELLSSKMIDLVKLYTRGHYASEDVLEMIEQVLIEDGYAVRDEFDVSGSEEGQDIEE